MIAYMAGERVIYQGQKWTIRSLRPAPGDRMFYSLATIVRGDRAIEVDVADLQVFE
jgi:hypothetical protein